MVDQEYSVKLDDEISPGLKRIISLLEQIESKTKGSKVANSLDKTSNSLGKTSNKAKETSKSFEKLDKTLNVFSTPIGQIAGKFGFMGDLIEASTGKMIGMGGAAARLGVGILATGVVVGAFAAGLYGLTKAAMFFDEQTTSMNSSILEIRGSLNALAGDEKDVIKQSMELSTSLGKSYLDTAKTMSKPLNSGATKAQAEQLTILQSTMEKFGTTGKDVNKTLEAVYAGKGKLQADYDIRQLLIQTGNINDQMSELEKKKQVELFKTKNTKEQLGILTSNVGVMNQMKTTLEGTVPATEKIKTAFANMFAKALGDGGQFNDLVNQITEWTKKEENINKIKDAFIKFSDVIKNIDPSKLESVANTSLSLLNTIGDIAKFVSDHPIITKMLLGGAAGSAGGLPGMAIGAGAGFLTGLGGEIGGSSFAESEDTKKIKAETEAVNARIAAIQNRFSVVPEISNTTNQSTVSQQATDNIQMSQLNAMEDIASKLDKQTKPSVTNANQISFTINGGDTAQIRKTVFKMFEEAGIEVEQ